MESERAEEEAVKPIGNNGWRHFDGLRVFLQLREEYCPPTYAYELTRAVGADGVEGVAAVPFISGVLMVEDTPDGGVLLIVKRKIGDGEDVVVVALEPRQVMYCTHIHQPPAQLIAAP